MKILFRIILVLIVLAVAAYLYALSIPAHQTHTRTTTLKQTPEAVFALVQAPSYAFFFESLFVLHTHGFRIREIPIVLPARTYGHSKMTLLAAAGSLRIMLGVAAAHRRRRAP